MEIDRARLKALLSRLDGLDEDDKKRELARTQKDEPRVYAQFSRLVEAARAAENAAQARAEDPKLAKALSAAAQTPRLQRIAATLSHMSGHQSGQVASVVAPPQAASQGKA